MFLLFPTACLFLSRAFGSASPSSPLPYSGITIKMQAFGVMALDATCFTQREASMYLSGAICLAEAICICMFKYHSTNPSCP